LIKIGKELAQHSDVPAVRSAKWLEHDLEIQEEFPSHDCVILSYSIGELKSPISLLEKAWQATKKLLLIVEPGTPVGFDRIRNKCKQLIDWGAHLVAPCPHQAACPMQGGDWCHFAARVERTSLHRKLKSGTLGYEDEKFSYIAAAKNPVVLPPSRILSPPDKHSGHILLKLCTAEGVKTPTLSKKMGDPYKKARKADWGDAIF
jgi:ribosomal protein RSM22 (predicted rRNA methylase)